MAAALERSRRIIPGEATFRGLVMILQRDHEPLDGAQRQQGGGQNERHPQQRVNPIRRRIQDFHRQSRTSDDEPGEKHDEKSRCIRGIGERKIEATPLAGRAQGEKALKQSTVAAAGQRPTRPAMIGDGGTSAWDIERHLLRKSLNWKWALVAQFSSWCRTLFAPGCAANALARTADPNGPRRAPHFPHRPPRRRCRKTGTAKPRQRNASTKQQIRTRDAAWA